MSKKYIEKKICIGGCAYPKTPVVEHTYVDGVSRNTLRVTCRRCGHVRTISLDYPTTTREDGTDLFDRHNIISRVRFYLGSNELDKLSKFLYAAKRTQPVEYKEAVPFIEPFLNAVGIHS